MALDHCWLAAIEIGGATAVRIAGTQIRENLVLQSLFTISRSTDVAFEDCTIRDNIGEVDPPMEERSWMFGVYWSSVQVANCQIVGNRFRELESTPGSIKLGATNRFSGNGFPVGPSSSP